MSDTPEPAMTEDVVRLVFRAVEDAMVAEGVDPKQVRAVIRRLLYGPPPPVDPEGTMELDPKAIMLTPAEFLDYAERTHGAGKGKTT